jgi:NDP-sugar pyrophosphorylase family protein
MTLRDLPPLILLCGGSNDRLQELRGTIYKPFLDLHGSTMAAKHLERARRDGISRAIVVTDRADPMVDALVAGYREGSMGMDVELLHAPGDTREKCRRVMAELGVDDGDLFVSFADTFCWFSYGDLVATRTRTGTDSVTVVSQFQMPFGTVVTSGERVVEFRETPTMTYDVNLGQMLLGPEALGEIRKGSTIAGSLEFLAARDRLGAVRAEFDRFITVDSLSAIAHALGFFAKHPGIVAPTAE